MSDSRRRILLGAFGDPGHAFPMIALGRALVARGHEVTLQTWARWREHVEAEGMTFATAPEYQVFPQGPEPLDFYEAVVHATRDTLPLVRELRPHAVVADILTLAPALAGELERVPVATLIPHVYPHGERDFPIYSLGARLPRGALGRWLWRSVQRPVDRGLELGRDRAERHARTRRPAPSAPRPRRHQPPTCARGDVPAARVPAGMAGARARGGTADVGAADGRRGARRRATSRSC